MRAPALRAVLTAAAAWVAIAGAGCGGGGPTTPAPDGGADRVLAGLTVTPAEDMQLCLNGSCQFAAVASYRGADGPATGAGLTTEDVTDRAKWTWTGPACAGCVATAGCFTAGGAEGEGRVEASYGGLTASSGTITVVCEPPVITEAAVTADPDPMTAAGGTVTVTALIADASAAVSATVLVTAPDGTTAGVNMAQDDHAWSAVCDIPANDADVSATYTFAVTATDSDGCTSSPFAAGSVTVPSRPVLSGTVTAFHMDPALSGQPLPGIPVWVAETGDWTRTDGQGRYSFPVAPLQELTVGADSLLYDAAPGEQTSKAVSVGGDDVTVDFALMLLPAAPPGQGIIHGFVVTAQGAPICAALVAVGDRSVTTDGNGEYLVYQWADLPCTVTAASTDYSFQPAEQSLTVTSGAVHELEDFVAAANGA